jgi:hypothetical protein
MYAIFKAWGSYSACPEATFDLPESVKGRRDRRDRFVVRDLVMGNEFINRAKLPVLTAVENPSGPKPKPKPKPGEPPGATPDGQAGLDFPEVRWVKREDPNWSHRPCTARR